MNAKKLLTCAGIACCVGTTSAVLAEDHDNDNEIPFEVAEIFFELNDTDGDLGIHGLIDGGPWKSLAIEDHRERTAMKVLVRGRARQQGMTEFFFESAEPPFDELTPAAFFRRFPAGIYEVEGRSLEGEELESETRLTHRMPAPPAPTVNGMPMAVQCDEDEPGYDAPTVSAPVIISWPEVTRTHPTIGTPKNSPNINIFNYEFVIEVELEDLTGPDGDAFVSEFSFILPPDVTQVTVPEEMLALSDEFKYEVLVREASFNQTAVESCFLLE